MTKTVNLRVENSDQLRDSLNHSGIFEMLDCSVEINCNTGQSIQEIDRMFTIIHSVINVVDSNFTPDETIDDFHIEITEVAPPFSNGKFTTKK